MRRAGLVAGCLRSLGRPVFGISLIFFLGGLVLGGLVLGGLARSLHAEEPLSLDYDLYAGGFHAISFETEFTFEDESYQAQLKMRSNGLIDTLFRFTLEATADGRNGVGGLKPSSFRTANRWRASGERLVEISYDGPGALPRTVVRPSAEEDERDPVPEDLQRNTLDPLSAIVNLIQSLARNGRCDSTVAVFDGRRRYDLAARHLGEITLKASDAAPYAGPAVKCGIEIERVVGRWKKKNNRWKDAGQPVIHAFLARIEPDAPLVPVRIEAENKLGKVRVHLVGSGGASLGAP